MRRKVVTAVVSVVVLALLAVGGGYIFLQRSIDSINKLHVSDEVAVQNGAPFTVLVIGSDTRVGQNSQAFGSSAEVTGQRSDVVQLWRVTPSNKEMQVLSIPRDTVVSLLGANATEFGTFNRINSAFDSGTDQLVQTITANFGIPINHVAVIDFSGFEDAVNAVGGVYLDFNYPAKDAYSGLDITTPGCQLLSGAQALAVARSRHYQYYANGEWQYDGTSDFGRIQRQDAFLRSLITAVKSKETNPIALAKFAGSLHEGLEIDDGFSANQLIGLAETYRSFDAGRTGGADVAHGGQLSLPRPRRRAGGRPAGGATDAGEHLRVFPGHADQSAARRQRCGRAPAGGHGHDGTTGVETTGHDDADHNCGSFLRPHAVHPRVRTPRQSQKQPNRTRVDEIRGAIGRRVCASSRRAKRLRSRRQ